MTFCPVIIKMLTPDMLEIKNYKEKLRDTSKDADVNERLVGLANY